MSSRILKTVEAVVEENGNIRLLEDVQLRPSQKALVTLLDEEYEDLLSETMLLSEDALAEEWNNEEEDQAWAHLQQAQ